jgi:hypothetical protein
MPSRRFHDSFATTPLARRDGATMKTLAIILVVGGATLALAGLLAMSAASSDFSRFLGEAPPNRTPWVMLLGVALFAAGVVASWRTFRRPLD